MLKLNVFIGLLILMSVTAEINYEIFADSEHPNRCVVPTPTGQKVIIDSGQSRRHPSKCSQIVCGRKGWALVYSCDLKSPPNDCEFTDYKNFDASYPNCCERELKCKKEDKLDTSNWWY